MKTHHRYGDGPVLCHRLGLFDLLGVLLFFTGLAAVNLQAQSDSLFINYNGVNQTFTVPGDAGAEGALVVPVGTPLIPKKGYILFFEPDGTTLSDVLVTFTGSSIDLHSDGDPLMQPIYDSLKTSGLPLLATFIERDDGITEAVGTWFGLASDQIIVSSDGDNPTTTAVPEPATAGYLGFALLGVIVSRALTRRAGQGNGGRRTA